MYYERGPQGKIHIPSYQNGCYHGRITDCCLLCMGRIGLSSSTAPVRYQSRDARDEDDHDLVGENVLIPYVDHSTTSIELDYREGTIEKVQLLDEEYPAQLRVETKDGEEVHIDLMTDARKVQ